MKLLATIVGLLVVALGALGLIAPDDLVTIGRNAVTPAGVYVIAGLRVCVGLVLTIAAPRSQMPKTVRILGAIALINGITTPMFGVDRSRAAFNWWASQGPFFIRLASVIAAAFGAF